MSRTCIVSASHAETRILDETTSLLSCSIDSKIAAYYSPSIPLRGKPIVSRKITKLVTKFQFSPRKSSWNFLEVRMNCILKENFQ